MAKSKVYREDGTYKRIFEVDLIRGICIALVMLDHLLYNFWAYRIVGIDFFERMYSFAVYYWNHPIRIYTRYVVIAIFFLISGLSSSFSKNNFTRAVEVLFVAIMLTIVTTIAGEITGNRKLVIDFGVIHVFGCSILFFAMIKDWKNILLVAVSGLCFFAWWYISGLEIVTTVKWFLPIGITPIGYVYGDYFSLFPWLGFFVLGGVIGKVFYRTRTSIFKRDFKPKASKGVLAMGRHSLFYYFGEQIVLIPIFYILAVLL